MSDDAKGLLDEVDGLVARGRQRDRIVAARSKASAAGGDPDMAAREAAREPLVPLKLAGVEAGVSGDWQHPVIRARIERIRAAMTAGRVSPAEGARIFEAMSADEAAASALLARMPEGRIPLEPRALAPDPENPVGSGPLPDGWSLLSRTERAELAERGRRR